MKKFKKFMSVVLAVVMILCVSSTTRMQEVSAAGTITGNNTKGTAYNFGRWQLMANANKTAVLEKNKTEAWFEFTVEANEHIYIRCSSDARSVGMNAVIQDGLGNEMCLPQSNPKNLIGKWPVTALYLECDNTSSTTKTYYVVVKRGSDDSSQGIYFSLSADSRIKSGNTTFTFPGRALNAGNSALSLSGMNSTVLMLDLTDSTKIPTNAIVKSISTSGKVYGQSGIHHMVMPKNNGIWYTSTIASNSSGMYTIDVDDNIKAHQVWNFKYNALAGAKSEMSKVSLLLEWQYDLKDTKYEFFKVSKY